LTSSAHAYVNPQPGKWAAAVEFLIFRPSNEQSYYAISSDLNRGGIENDFFPNGTRYNNDPDFDLGYRFEIAYGLCDGIHEGDFRFTHFNTENTDSVNGGFLFDTLGYPGNGAQDPEDNFYSGRTKYTERFLYNAFDLTFNRMLLDCCPEYLFFIVGLHYAYIKVEEKLNSLGTSLDGTTTLHIVNRLSSNSRFWGIGPQLGIDYRYILPNLCFCPMGDWSLIADARASLLASRTKTDFHYNSRKTAGSFGVNLQNQPLWRITPCLDVKLGLNYDTCFFCKSFNFEAGYEFLWYSDAIDHITQYDVAFVGDSFDNFSNLSLQGPYIAIGVAF
jgi:hypothetical protein